MPDPIVLSYALQAAAYATLVLLLVTAIIRNHFVHHRVRPVIAALAFISVTLAVQNGMRVHSSLLRTTGHLEAYQAFIASPWWFWPNMLSAAGVVVLIITLLLAYPESRR
jgi:hypothetical protein